MLSRHTTYLDTPDWPGLFPSYLSLCAGAWSMVACSEFAQCWVWMHGRMREIQYLKITINCTDAALCSFLDCVQCVFNDVCSLKCGLRARNLPLQEIHLCNLSETQPIPWFHPDWPDEIPFAHHGRVQWVVLDVNVACGPKTKRNAFPRRLMDEIL